MPIELMLFLLWVTALFLVVWQAVLTVQLRRLRASSKAHGSQDVNLVGIGLLYNGLIDELRQTADQKIALLDQRIQELEDLLEEHEAAGTPGTVHHVSFADSQLRRCG